MYNRFFLNKLKKHLSELSGLKLFTWNNLVIVKNNELVIDFLKLPRKLNVVLAEETAHEMPEELLEPFAKLTNMNHRSVIVSTCQKMNQLQIGLHHHQMFRP